MKTIPERELYNRYLATQGQLAHLKTVKSRRRFTWGNDFHAIDDPFVRDMSVLECSKAWRRMGGKNQVASSPLAPHIRNRSTHVSEVRAHSSRIADHLGLNVMLSLSIASGHDIGHVPFGHQGEKYLKDRLGKKITHETLGVIIAQRVERIQSCGSGLNLTYETLDGMYRHSGANAHPGMTPEAWVVRYADKIAYLFADYNDFDRMGWPCDQALVDLMSWFGHSQRDRTFRTMMALCEESVEKSHVSFETSEPAVRFSQLRSLMYREYERVVEQDVSRFLDPIYDLLDRSGMIPPWLGIALLTDVEVHHLVGEKRMLSWRDLVGTGMGEIVRAVDREKLFAIDPMELGLEWGIRAA